MNDIQKLKLDAKGFSLLYVEDNEVLREKTATLLHKFFSHVAVAVDGQDGLEKFKKQHYHLVVTDIKMPRMDGLVFASKIRKISSDVKIIIMSAYDEKEYLLEAITFRAFGYLKKPVTSLALVNLLDEAVLDIKKERTSQLFQMQLQSIFNHQSSMVAMYRNKKILVANDMFLDFFNLETLDLFEEKVGDLGDKFLKHDGFLCKKVDPEWFETLQKNEQKLFNVKIRNKHNAIKHLIVKYKKIPQKEGYGILSLDDVTELNLFDFFDKDIPLEEGPHVREDTMSKLLELLKSNTTKVEVHNYYKGLSITNDALISNVVDETICLKTKFSQLKAIQYEKKTYISSEFLPEVIACNKVEKIVFESQELRLNTLHFVKTSPVDRKTIRVTVATKHVVSLFIGENKFHGEVKIEDISLDAIRLNLATLPAGLDIECSVRLDIVLEMDKRPLILNFAARVYKKTELRTSFDIVFIFQNIKKSDLVKYITKRQMAIIREFKGMQNG
ncbi:response regulator [Sulfurimonas sp. SAG-AH-194-I05]|nr:response regulator [Sulfurimonas sp. SAG-AH-194-I05]MDF1875156.1 response regulator [Sulfurimonas sp. SAG-AH-194-I05]